MSMTQLDVRPHCATCGADMFATDPYCRHCGHGRAGAPPVAAPDTGERVDPAVALLPTRPSATSVVVAASVVAALLALTVPILIIRATLYGPDDTARAYFAALADRDADAAWALLAEDHRGTREAHPLLTAATLRDEGYTPPSNVEVDNVSTDGDEGVAEVAFDAAGQAQRMSLALTRTGGQALQRWHVKGALLSLSVGSDSGGEIVVAGTRLAPGAGQLLAFPGGYAVGLPEDDPLLAAAPVTAVAGAEPVALRAELKANLREEIEKQVRAYVDRCAASNSLTPEGCPLRAYAYNVRDVKWRIVSYPQLQYTVDEGRVFVQGEGGQARVTAKAASAFSSDFSQDVAFGVGGAAVVTGGGVQFTPAGD
jgi:hypothetical protein